MERAFGTADFYSSNLRALGHEAQDVIINATPLQRQWAHENARKLPSSRFRDPKSWQLAVVAEQIKQAHPDVLYIQNVNFFDATYLESLRQYFGRLVGQTGYAIDWNFDFGPYDLMLSCFPHYVKRFRAMGKSSDYLAIGFGAQVLDKLPKVARDLDVTFVGAFRSHDDLGMAVLEQVARRLPVAYWGYGVESMPAESPIRRCYQGNAWGLDMYRLLARSKVTLNRHGNVSQGYANNMRLFEGTGVGACLVTDMKSNLSKLFEIDREVVAYENPADCLEKVKYLLDHDDERAAIALAGQQRTLREHTYAHRMRELEDILEKHQGQPGAATRRTFGGAPFPPVPRRLSPRELTRAAVRASPLAPLARWSIKKLRTVVRGQPISSEHQIVSKKDADGPLALGWKNTSIVRRQRQLVDKELEQMYHGDVIPVYRVAAEAVRSTMLENPLIVDIGCAGGYYSEVLTHLLGRPIHYVGIDYAPALVQEAQRRYPGLPVIIGDATSIPLKDDCCDILLHASCLQHTPDYETAIQEAARVVGKWAIFHRTPVLQSGDTVYLSKQAYGVAVPELLFAEEELREVLSKAGFEITREFSIGPYGVRDLGLIGEIKTFVCSKR